MKHPRVSWYDPNFGVKFNLMMETIESAVPPGSIDFIAECTLSVLNEANVKRLQKNGFRMIMPGYRILVCLWGKDQDRIEYRHG